VCFDPAGTGVGQWPVEGPNGFGFTIPCLGIWASNDDYYIVFVPPYLSTPDLAKEVFSGLRASLPMHWLKKGSLPREDEATPLFGKVRFYNEPVKVLIR
jgi:hypothetical protein